MTAMERITRQDVAEFKREFLENNTLIRVEEAAMILAVSKSTIVNRINEGRLTPYNDNSSQRGCLRFLASELKRYVREMRQDNRQYE